MQYKNVVSSESSRNRYNFIYADASFPTNDDLQF